MSTHPSDLAWRPPIYSTARLDALVCPVLVERDVLAATLPVPGRLTLPPMPGVPGGLHPVILEVWRVNDGSIEFAGLPLHGWWEMAGRWWGQAIGAALGGRATKGPDAETWGRIARGASEASSRVIGTYNEVLATVPCTLDVAGRPIDVSFVLRACTDSPFSLVGERFFGWGYRKTSAQGRVAADGSIDMELARGERVRVSTSASPESAASPATVISAFTRPLLGVRPPGRLMLSYLDRTFTHPTVNVRGLHVALEGAGLLHAALAASSGAHSPSTVENPWGAFLVTGLPSTLTYPRALDG